MLTDYYFWFAQPSSFLSGFDKTLGIAFACLLGVGLILLVSTFVVKNLILRKLINRFRHLFFWVGIVGLIWFGFRFEGTPLLAKRIWPALIVFVGLVWLGFVLKYLLLRFKQESRAYAQESIKQKYLPKSK